MAAEIIPGLLSSKQLAGWNRNGEQKEELFPPHLWLARLATALGRPIDGHGAVLLGSLEQILHQLVGTLLPRRTHDLLPTPL